MDDLELLKKDWNKNKNEFKNYSEKELFAMVKVKTISVAKLAFIIAIAEILILNLLSFLIGDEGIDERPEPLYIKIIDILVVIFCQ